MLYSSAGFLALIIHLIINHDVLRESPEREIIPAHRAYRMFLFAVSVYYVTDILWGFLYENGLATLTFLDTALYFAAMGCSILFWTRFVVDYLREKRFFGHMLLIVGWLFFAYEMLVLMANFFVPVLYSMVDGVYRAEAARYITLAVQTIMYLTTAIYALVVAMRSTGTMKLRHRTIGISSVAMAGFITAQTFFPLLPLYAIGCMLSTCVLHSFVLENEKEEYRDRLEARLEENILKGNYYDLLTGLAGMSYFFDLARDRRAGIEQDGGTFAFLFVNLGGMKFYNRNHGFSEGDKLLRTLAKHLSAAFGPDNCSRLGEDHFAVVADSRGLEKTLKKLFTEWKAVNVGDCPPILVGVYLGDEDVIAACDLAKIACDSVSDSYASTFRYFDATMFHSAEHQQFIIARLDQALAQKWIQVYYQPIVRAASGRVCDEEALARWIDPERGFLSPAEFIPMLEKAKLIYKLDLYVLEQVLEKLHRQQARGLWLVPQSINLSRSDFDACDMVEEIRLRVDAAGIEHRLITIEITESIIGSDFDFIKGQIERFRALGFPVWMDDFGSGYSSLDVLQSLQVDLIKFDMRFMQQFNHDEKSRIILTELMKMAVGLGMDTVCEGVEREDQAAFLREIGCAKLQGYLYTKPLPVEEVFARYDEGRQIGFENPEETGYFDAIGRINLYDLSAITNEDADSLGHYFDTVPMAIIEVRGETTRFTRSNSAYRDFFRRMYHVGLSEMGSDFTPKPGGPGGPFVEMLFKCAREGGRLMYDGLQPDGSTVHCFVRRIGENPLTETTALAVAVLAVTTGATDQY